MFFGGYLPEDGKLFPEPELFLCWLCLIAI